MRILGFLCCAAASWSCFAGFNQLANEFLQVNTEVRVSRINHAQTNLEYDALRATKDWDLAGSLGYSEDNLDRNNPFFEPSSTKSISGTLSKDFDWGGRFSFQSSLENVVEEQAQSTLLVAEDLTQFSQGLSYSQDLGRDFFGKKFRSSVKISKLKNELSLKELNERSEKLLFDFYQAYTSASVLKTLKSLREEAQRRAQRRRDNVAKRVRDGLKEKVDLYESDIFLLTSQENTRDTEKLLQEELQKLSNSLNRNVKVDEIDTFTLDNPRLKEKLVGTLDKNRSLKILEERVKVAREESKRTIYDLNPDVSLVGEYKTNRFNADRGDAISDGKLGGDRDFWSIALNVSLPIGFQSEKISRSQTQLSLLASEISLNNSLQTLKHIETSVGRRLDIQKLNIESGTQKRSLAKKSVKSFNRLYNLGRTDLDRVIRAEENLISTETGLVSLLADYNRLLAEQSRLYGKFADFVGLD
jgi:outer membrane protein TolC